MSEERVHHPYSPSTLQAREACPKYSPLQSENEAATMGTLQHDSVESGIDDDRIPDYRAAAVAECLKFTEERLKDFPGGVHVREAYLPIDDEMVTAPDGTKFKGTTAGYVDFAVISADETEAEIADWKFGQWAVTKAEENLQGIAYMLGLKKVFPKLQRCTVRFVQPHIDFSTHHTFEISDPSPYLLRVRTVVQRAIEAARNPTDFSSANPNTGACVFCALVGRCPKVAELALKVGEKFAPLALPGDISTTALSDPAQVAVGLKLAQVVKAWAEAYRRQATAKSIEDDFIPDGYKLVSSQRTVIKNARNVGDAAKALLPPEDAEKVEALYDIALTPLDKLISLRAPRGFKEDSVKKFRESIIESGAAELGAPFAFLRQISVEDEQETQK